MVEEAHVRLQPTRQCEVVEGHDRREPMLAATDQHATVVIERRPRELALFGLDPRPLDAQAQRVEAEPSHQDDVVAIAVVEIAGVTGGLDAGCAGRVFPGPPVAVDIAPLDLVSRLRGAEQKALGEGPHAPYIKTLSITPAEALSRTPRSEYPRPRLRRRDWASLNGTWQFAFDAPDFDRSIVVPFAYQSVLSGIGERALPDTLWYRRRFTRPEADRLILHFGAVDYAATVWVNDVEVACHEGGHTPFSIDITAAARGGDNELVVRADDPASDPSLPRGKQTCKEKPEGIFYTATTGIWQTVWLEPPPPRYLTSPSPWPKPH